MTWFDPAGSSLLGPSSEWFWTMLSTIAVIVSLLAIFRELRLQTAVKETQQVNEVLSEWESERLSRQRLRLYEGIRDGEPTITINAAWRIAAFWEKVGSLVRVGHMDREMLIDNGGSDSVMFWVLLGDFVHEARRERSTPTAFENFEWLAGVVDSSRHDVAYLHRPLTPEKLADLIDDETTYIAVEVALRTPSR